MRFVRLMPNEALKIYARRIRELQFADANVSEPALAPAFQQLLIALLPTLDAIPQLTVSPEFNNPGVGRPDIALITPGQPPRAFVELKAPAKSADPTRWRDPHDNPLLQVRATFRDVLYAHPEAGGYAAADFDALFAGAFAQTLAFGLLLVREGSGAPVDEAAWERMPVEHPLMRAALRVLSMPEVVADFRIGFEVMRDTVNSFAPAILAIDAQGRDPILYFYEDFLAIFDPAARERYGVYYTPVEVVRYMVGALDRALRDELGTAGLRDPAVTILDPATGTGTFPLGVAERVRADTLAETESEAEAQMALRELAGRLYGFELLVGPYAVAHYRLHHALARPPIDPATGEPPEDWTPPALPRLGIYLTDTLARPGGDAPAGPLGFVAAGIQDERREANRIKAEQPILAIIGNPPYRRLKRGENETLVGRWMDELWSDLKQPVSDAGWGNQLNTFPELSVAFWRWAMWKLFESDNAPRRGVVAFITNRKFLTGKPYAGVRKMMRERFDHIQIIDLRGDGRTGARADITDDQNVFDIRVGVCITIGVAHGGSSPTLAEVSYVDAWAQGAQSRSTKLEALTSDLAGWCSVAIDRDRLEDLRPVPFPDLDSLNLDQCFSFYAGGVQSARDEIVYDPAEAGVFERVRAFQALSETEAKKSFRPTKRRPLGAAHKAAVDPSVLRRIAFRPLDFRFLYAHDSYVEYMRAELLGAWGAENVCLYAMPFGTGRGAALWTHSTYPDYQALSERGGYAFPLYDRRAGPDATNLSAVLLDHLGDAYGGPVAPADVFDAILALLSAASYTRRFAEDLEDTFPHVPFPANKAVFDRAVAVGREIRAVETFARAPRAVPGLARMETQTADGDHVQAVTYRDGAIVLAPDGRGRLSGIPAVVWEFAVSGYRVLPRWIDGRKGQPATLAFIRELRDVALRIAELIHRFDKADLVLADTLAHTLTRAELGFGDAAKAVDGDDD